MHYSSSELLIHCFLRLLRSGFHKSIRIITRSYVKWKNKVSADLPHAVRTHWRLIINQISVRQHAWSSLGAICASGARWVRRRHLTTKGYLASVYWRLSLYLSIYWAAVTPIQKSRLKNKASRANVTSRYNWTVPMRSFYHVTPFV